MSAEIAIPGTFRGYPVKVRNFEIGKREFRLLGPANYECLIDEPAVVKRFEKDEFLPYWAEFWPACVLLAEQVAGWPAVESASGGPGGRPRVLEIGCGLGLPSIVALARGYDVLASDYDDDALAFVAESARVNQLPVPTLRFVDWRERYDDLRFDRVIAAEILYERRSLGPIAEFLRYHLRPAGEALLVDANRPTADAFPEIARAAGLRVEVSPLEGTAGGTTVKGRLMRLAHG